MTRRAPDGDTEAREWLEREDNVERSLGELEPADSAELVERFYRSGAVRVELQGLETYAADEDGATFRFESARKLRVVLPDDPKARRRILERAAEAALDHGAVPEEDNGQLAMAIVVGEPWWAKK